MPEFTGEKVDAVSREVSNKISNLSFVCSVLVLLIHTERSAECASINWITGTISQIGVPFFFAVSGFLILNRYSEDSWYKNVLTKRFWSLLIPFICLNVLWFPFKYAIHYVGYLYFGADHSNPTMVFSFLNFLRAFSPIAVYGSPCVGPLWYVRALMWLAVFSPIVAWCVCKSKKICATFMVGVVVLWCLQLSNIIEIGFVNSDNMGLDYSFRCLFYFAFGMCVRKWRLWNIRTQVGIFALVMGVVLLSINYSLGNQYLGVVGVFVSIVGFWSIAPSDNWPKWMTKNCYAIYAFHTIMIYIGHTALKAVKLTSYFDQGIGAWGLTGFYLFGCCIVGYVIRKYSPKLSIAILGGR